MWLDRSCICSRMQALYSLFLVSSLQRCDSAQRRSLATRVAVHGMNRDVSSNLDLAVAATVGIIVVTVKGPEDEQI